MSQISRTRSLERVNWKILRGSRTIEETISVFLSRQARVNVLEVGFGWGRALLELAWKFRHHSVAFHGIDKDRKSPVETREDLRDIARQLAIAPEPLPAEFALPEIYFYDATKLHFDDESLDLVYSAVTFRFIPLKVEFLEEVGRVLKPGGIAFIHLSETKGYPYSVALDNDIMTPFETRFVLKHENELIPLPAYLGLYKEGPVSIEVLKNLRSIIIRKNATGRLDLRLDFNPELSLPLQDLNIRHRTRADKVADGYRSVYDVRPEAYRAMFEKGLLARDQLQTGLKIPDGFLLEPELA